MRQQWQNIQGSHRDNALEAVEQNGSALEFVDLELRADREIVLAAVRQNGTDLQYASEELREDKEIVLAAVRQNGTALQYASEELREDSQVVLEALESAVKNTKKNTESPQENKELFFFLTWYYQSLPDDDAEKIDSFIENFVANSTFLRNKAVILEAVKQNGDVLQLAKQELQKDREVVLAAVRQDGFALRYASKELQADREVVLAALGQDGEALRCASKELQADREIVLEAVRNNGNSLEFASEELRRNQGIVLEAVRQNGTALQYADPEFIQNNPKMFLIALRQEIDTLSHFDITQLHTDPAYFIHAMVINPYCSDIVTPQVNVDPTSDEHQKVALENMCNLYTKEDDNQEKGNFRTDIVNFITQLLQMRGENGKPINIIPLIDFAKFGDIRKDPKVIAAIIANYSQEEGLNGVLHMTIFAMGGDSSNESKRQEIFEQIEQAGLLRLLDAEKSTRWQNFKQSYSRPNPDVASASSSASASAGRQG